MALVRTHVESRALSCSVSTVCYGAIENERGHTERVLYRLWSPAYNIRHSAIRGHPKPECQRLSSDVLAIQHKNGSLNPPATAQGAGTTVCTYNPSAREVEIGSFTSRAQWPAGQSSKLSSRNQERDPIAKLMVWND